MSAQEFSYLSSDQILGRTAGDNKQSDQQSSDPSPEALSGEGRSGSEVLSDFAHRQWGKFSSDFLTDLLYNYGCLANSSAHLDSTIFASVSNGFNSRQTSRNNPGSQSGKRAGGYRAQVLQFDENTFRAVNDIFLFTPALEKLSAPQVSKIVHAYAKIIKLRASTRQNTDHGLISDECFVKIQQKIVKVSIYIHLYMSFL